MEGFMKHKNILLIFLFASAYIFGGSVILTDGVQAQVISVSPAKNALNVSPTTTIQVTFSEAMMTSLFNDAVAFFCFPEKFLIFK